MLRPKRQCGFADIFAVSNPPNMASATIMREWNFQNQSLPMEFETAKQHLVELMP